MNNFSLKLLAIIAMLIDHIGAIIFPQYLWLRVVGRIAFPIFCFLIVEGFYHTSNVKKYLIRLGIFAFVSEIPFDIAFYNKIMYIDYQNVFFTLFLGLIVIYLMSMVKNNFVNHTYIINILHAFVVIIGCATSIILKTDYSYIGILLIVAFYLFRDNKLIRCIVIIFITGLQGSFPIFHIPIEMYASTALIPISFYNGKKGPSMKYVFYLFYPLHLLCLHFIVNYIL